MTLPLMHQADPQGTDRIPDLLLPRPVPATGLTGWVQSQAPSLVALVEGDDTGRRHRILGWVLDFGDRKTEMLAVDSGVHLRGLGVEELVATLDHGDNRVHAVTVHDRGRTGAGAVVSGEPDLSRPLGPQLSGRSRVDEFRLKCLAELREQAAGGIAPGDLAARHGLTLHRLQTLLREASLTLRPDLPVGPQIRTLPYTHPVRTEGEALLARQFLARASETMLKNRHDVSTHILLGAVRRYCDGALIAGIPLGPQLRVHPPGTPARLLAERVIIREHADSGAQQVCARHLLTGRRLDAVLAATADAAHRRDVSSRPTTGRPSRGLPPC